MQTDTTPHLPVNHVFVDLENVKSIDPRVRGGKNFTFHLFYGPQNKKLDMGVVERLFENSQSVKIVRSPKTRKNALDFVLAYHLGQAVQSDPKGSFHIVAPDMGYESLVELLRSRNVEIQKHADWSGLKCRAAAKVAVIPPTKTPPAAATPAAKAPAVAKPAAKGLSVAAEKLLKNLRKSEKNRPKKEKTLAAHARNFSGKDKPEADAAKVIEELRKAGHLAIDEKGAVTYQL